MDGEGHGVGHEITHVANGDMVTLALIQGVLNTFVIFLARAIGIFGSAGVGLRRLFMSHPPIPETHCGAARAGMMQIH